MTILDEMRVQHQEQLRQTRGDFAGFRSEMRDDFAEFRREMRADMQAFEARLEVRLDARFTKIDERFERVDARFVSLEAKVGDVKSDLMKWSFVFWCGAVAAVAALAGVLRS